MTPNPTRLAKWRTAAGAVACAVLLALAGCTKDQAGKDDNMKTLAEADATTQVNQYAQKVADLIGNTKLENPATNGSACEGKQGEFSREIYTVLGAYQVPLPREQHVPTLTRLRDQWRQQGYTITDDRSFNDGTGVLTVKDRDGYTVNLESTTPPNAFALIINTPCYKSPTPRP